MTSYGNPRATLGPSLAMSDRLIVMYKGRIRAELRHDELDHELVMSLATGADSLSPQHG